MHGGRRRGLRAALLLAAVALVAGCGSSTSYVGNRPAATPAGSASSATAAPTRTTPATPAAATARLTVTRTEQRRAGRDLDYDVARVAPSPDVPAAVAQRVDALLAAERERGLTSTEVDGVQAVALRVTQVPTLPGLVAARYDWSYGVGGMHPVGGTTYVVASLSDGSAVGPRRLVRADRLAALSAAARRMLVERYGAGTLGDAVDEGTRPTWANFAAMAPTPDGLHVVFRDYQVGPYALGRPEITIPWSVARDWLPAPLP